MDKVSRDEFLLLVDLMVATHGYEHCCGLGSELDFDEETSELESAAYAYIYWRGLDEKLPQLWKDEVERILDEVTHEGFEEGLPGIV